MPQATGILAGRKDLVGSALLQMLDIDDHFDLWKPPRTCSTNRSSGAFLGMALAKALKVSKEQIVALLTALRLFTSGAYDAEVEDKQRSLEAIVAGLKGTASTCVIHPVAEWPIAAVARNRRRRTPTGPNRSGSVSPPACEGIPPSRWGMAPFSKASSW